MRQINLKINFPVLPSLPLDDSDRPLDDLHLVHIVNLPLLLLHGLDGLLNDLHLQVKIVHIDYFGLRADCDRTSGFELAASLVFLPDPFHSNPAAARVQTPDLQIIDDIPSEQVSLLKAPPVHGVPALGAVMFEVGPLHDADIAEGVTI